MRLFKHTGEIMEFKDFVQWAFYGLITYHAMDFKTVIKELKDSVVSLNINMAIVIEKMAGHEKRIEKLEEKQNS